MASRDAVVWQLGLVIVVTLVFVGVISWAAWLMNKMPPDDKLDDQHTSKHDPADPAESGVSAAEILSRLKPEYDDGDTE